MGGRQTGKARLIADGYNDSLLSLRQFVPRGLAHGIRTQVSTHLTRFIPAPVGAYADANLTTGQSESCP
ncbi:MAG TPA: hypothetical protein DIW35_01825 [Psychrobacter sp.]|nr:hypothetical protein [Psychrobacter sp.]